MSAVLTQYGKFRQISRGERSTWRNPTREFARISPMETCAETAREFGCTDQKSVQSPRNGYPKESWKGGSFIHPYFVSVRIQVSPHCRDESATTVRRAQNARTCSPASIRRYLHINVYFLTEGREIRCLSTRHGEAIKHAVPTTLGKSRRAKLRRPRYLARAARSHRAAADR